MAAYFDKELFTFLKQLKKNNNREWFLRHKTLYEDKVKEPLLDFISDLRPHLLKICANLKVLQSLMVVLYFEFIAIRALPKIRFPIKRMLDSISRIFR